MSHRPARAGAPFLAVLTALAAALLLAAPAQARELTVVSCKAADATTPVSGQGWRRTGTGTGLARFRASTAACPQGGPMVVQIPAGRSVRGRDSVALRMVAPSRGSLTRIVLDRRVVTAGDITYRLIARTGGRDRVIEACAASRCSGFSGVADLALPARTTELRIRLGCPRGRCAGVGSPATVEVARTAVTVRETQPPQLRREPRGPLLDGGLQTGRRRVDLAVADAGTGVASVALEVAGQVVEEVPVPNAGRCQAPFTLPRPCRVGGTVPITFDTARLPNGAHVARLLVRDAAGNTRVTGRYDVRTLNGTSADGSRVVAELLDPPSTRRELTLTVDASEQAVVAGTVLDPAGNRLVGARVVVSTQVLERDAMQVVGETTTDGTGAYRLTLPPGPSRGVQVAYVDQAGTTLAYGVAVLQARPSVSLVLTRTGRGTFRWSGTVGTDPPLDRLNVVLEFRNPQGRWQQAGNAAQTNAFGRFSGSYRFTRRTGQRFTLRARMLPARGVPYASGTSPTRSIRAR